jgi:hypothetical protein
MFITVIYGAERMSAIRKSPSLADGFLWALAEWAVWEG